MAQSTLACTLVLAGLLSWSSLEDAKRMVLPDWLTVALLATGLVTVPWTGTRSFAESVAADLSPENSSKIG